MRSKTWIVQSVKNGFSHRPKEHNSLDSATAEASRLATQNPVDEFLIYELVRSVQVQSVVIKDVMDMNSAAGDPYDDYDDYDYPR